MRLIDADELMEHVYRDRLDSRELIAEMIRNAPTIEKQKNGKWLPDNNNYITPHFVCSACGMSQKVETAMYKPLWAFCPRCGARMMRGEQE